MLFGLLAVGEPTYVVWFANRRRNYTVLLDLLAIIKLLCFLGIELKKTCVALFDLKGIGKNYIVLLGLLGIGKSTLYCLVY